VSEWSPVFAGVIAVSVLTMAVIQVGALIVGARLARRLLRLADRVERQVDPLFAQLQTVGAEAARASALAAQQVERADRLFADMSARIEETATVVQSAVLTPARESLAVMAGLKAAFSSLRGLRDAALGGRPPHRSGAEDDGPLFIG
jgi:hypothetical protein